MKIFKNIKIVVLTISFIISSLMCTYSKGLVDDNYRNNVLYIAGIIDNLDNLNAGVTRNDFAKIVVKASPFKDYGGDFVKVATENKYMIRNIYGEFNGEVHTSYNDLIRACLALLSFTDNDFTGNKVNARVTKFFELHLNDNIKKNITDEISKQDILNAIYNTLKENINGNTMKLYETVFTDMTMDFDGELNASGLQNNKLIGPYLVKRNEEISIPYDITNSICYINGKVYSISDLKDDIYNYGYGVVYYDKFDNIVYSYTERDDVSSTVACKCDYVINVNYDASDMTTPNSIDVGSFRYKLSSEEMKFAFSFAGNLKLGDKIIMVYNKINDIIRRESGDFDQKDDGRLIKGSLITAFKYE